MEDSLSIDAIIYVMIIPMYILDTRFCTYRAKGYYKNIGRLICEESSSHIDNFSITLRGGNLKII